MFLIGNLFYARSLRKDGLELVLSLVPFSVEDEVSIGLESNRKSTLN